MIGKHIQVPRHNLATRLTCKQQGAHQLRKQAVPRKPCKIMQFLHVNSSAFSRWQCQSGKKPAQRSHVMGSTTPGLDQGPTSSTTQAYFWGSGMSRSLNLELALDQACAQALSTSAPENDVAPDLAIVFISSAYAEQYEQVVPILRARLPSIKHIVGCTGFGVIGMREGAEPEEVDTVPAVSVSLAYLPGVELKVSHVSMASLPDGDAPPSQWASLLGLEKQLQQQQEVKLQQIKAMQKKEQQQLDQQQQPVQDLSQESSNRQQQDLQQQQEGVESRSHSTGGEQEQEQEQLPCNSTSFVLLADPSFLKIQELLQGLDYAFPEAPKIGGLASAGSMNPSRAQWAWSEDSCVERTATNSGGPEWEAAASSREEQEGASSSSSSSSSGAFRGSSSSSRSSKGLYQTGVSVLALSGPVKMDLMVAQGCRPLSPYVWHIEEVAKDSNCVLALRREGPEEGQLAAAAVEPLEALREEIRAAVLSEVELTVLLANLNVGLAPDALVGQTQKLAPHDFLIRPLALDPRGMIAVGDYVRTGQRLRFMVREKASAEQDLISHGTALKKRQLQCLMEGTPLDPPIATLLFSCVGRGSNLHSKNSFDARTVASFLPVPTSGFLGNGEIGKVGSTTHLHGFTCAVGVLRAGKGMPLPPAARMPAEKNS